MLLAILIPAYNERDLLPRLVARVRATPAPTLPDGTPCRRVLVIVDDGSTDGTADAVRALGQDDDISSVVHETNQGKGAAIRTALETARSAAVGDQRGADLFLIQDADLEYDPADHQAVLQPILDGKADAVIGSRFLGLSHRVLYYWHAVANAQITRLSNMLTNLNLTDIECCSKAFTREVAAALSIRENRFGIEPEIVARLAKMRLPTEPPTDVSGGGASVEASPASRRARIYEVAVSYAGRTYEEGKKIGWRDGVRALWCIAKYNLMGEGTKGQRGKGAE
ncbi:MAG: glycosyltransferase family 2 protein [Phycisphaerales bacterium]